MQYCWVLVSCMFAAIDLVTVDNLRRKPTRLRSRASSVVDVLISVAAVILAKAPP